MEGYDLYIDGHRPINKKNRHRQDIVKDQVHSLQCARKRKKKRIRSLDDENPRAGGYLSAGRLREPEEPPRAAARSTLPRRPGRPPEAMLPPDLGSAGGDRYGRSFIRCGPRCTSRRAAGGSWSSASATWTSSCSRLRCDMGGGFIWWERTGLFGMNLGFKKCLGSRNNIHE